MIYWWFKFEGWFDKEAGEDAGMGVFSECLVKAGQYDDAEFEFLSALTNRHINLLEIEDNFPVDTNPDQLDYSNPDNTSWIEWCEETELAGAPTFGDFHLYPADEVEKMRARGN